MLAALLVPVLGNVTPGPTPMVWSNVGVELGEQTILECERRAVLKDQGEQRPEGLVLLEQGEVVESAAAVEAAMERR